MSSLDLPCPRPIPNLTPNREPNPNPYHNLNLTPHSNQPYPLKKTLLGSVNLRAKDKNTLF
jgi:hypothetical protein